jgi:hypothetical protein
MRAQRILLLIKLRFPLIPVVTLISLGCTNGVKPGGAIPQTVVGVEPNSNEPRFVFMAPDGFKWSDEHRIWYNKAIRTSVSMAHAPGISFQTVVDDFVPERMIAENLELLDKDIRDISGRPTLLVHANRRNSDYPQEMCTVAFGTKTGCAQITAIYPADMRKPMKLEIESALLNSRYEGPE